MVNFAQAVNGQTTRTTNGMVAHTGTMSACVDLFFKIGAMRGRDQEITAAFAAAYAQNPNIAVRIALWARDIRGGAGERNAFKVILKHLDQQGNTKMVKALIDKAPELGRWDDILVRYAVKEHENYAFDKILDAVERADGLACKWCPRKGVVADKLRQHRDWSWRYYRKSIVHGTKVVETQMCAKDWSNINFSHVPSIAANRYQKAFNRNAAEAYAHYREALIKGDNPAVKVNASAIFPHEVLRGLGNDEVVTTKQWEALVNNVQGANILPIVDVSGSMTWVRVGGTTFTPMDVAVALGLYCADKNKGAFKDVMLTFESTPKLFNLTGTLRNKYEQIKRAPWGGSTDVEAAVSKILEVAIKGNVSQEDMPSTLLILSDMQFNQGCVQNHRSIDMIRGRYAAAGYKVPQVVYWNLNAADNVPVTYREDGTALVSGFNTHVLKAVVNNDIEQFTPEKVMLNAVMVDRYKF